MCWWAFWIHTHWGHVYHYVVGYCRCYLLLFLTIFVVWCCSGKEDTRLNCISAVCFGTIFDMALAGDALVLSFKHSLFSSGWDLKWWYTFVVLPPCVAKLLRHTLHIKFICSKSSLLYPNHRQMMDPALFFLGINSPSIFLSTCMTECDVHN